MKPTVFSRMLGRAAAIGGMLSLFAVLAGCSDNATGPTANDNTPPGSTGTVEVSDPVSANEAEAVRVNLLRHSQDTIIITIDQVIQAALQNGGGELMGVNLDYDNDSLNYECVVRSGGKVYLVVIDPKTGQVKKKEEIQNYYYTTVIVLRQISVNAKDAKDRAKKISDGDVVECNLENIDDDPTYVVVILTRDNRYVTCYIDAKTGKEKKLKNDGKCDGSAQDNKRGRGHYRHGNGHGYGHLYHCHCNCNNGDTTGHDTTGVHDSTGVDSTKIPAGVITVDSARYVAGHVIDSTTVSDVKLRLGPANDSTAFYDAKLQRDSNRYEVTLDAFTGSVISIKQTAGDFKNGDYSPQVKGDSLVKLSVARTAAIAQLAGDVTAWKLEYDKTEAKWIYTFDIKTAANGTKQVMVDAKTGLFIRIK